MDDLQRAIGRRIRKLRSKRGWKQECDRIDAAITALGGTRGGRSTNGRRHRKPGRPPLVAVVAGKKRRRKLSAAAKKKISDAAKARWAKAKRAGKNSLGGPGFASAPTSFPTAAEERFVNWTTLVLTEFHGFSWRILNCPFGRDRVC